MKKTAAIILLGMAAVGCHDDDNPHSLFPVFDGTTGAAWEMMATATSGGLEGLQSYVPVNFDSIVNVDDTVQIYDIATDSWSDAANPGPVQAPWQQAAPVGDDLWYMKDNNIYKYVLATDTWTTEATWVGNDELSMTVSDEHGVIYAHSSDDNFIIYDTTQPPSATNPGYFAESVGTSTFETRLAYDPGTRSIFFGGYGDPELYQWEIDTGTVTQVASIPENQLNDIFCSDRSGHIYAAGDSGGTTMFQYDIATDTWSQIPDLPADHSNSYTCTVDAGGRYLYTSTGNQLYRLPLN